MNDNRFEYFLNAVHYGIWRQQIKIALSIDRILDIILYKIIKYFLPKKYYKDSFVKNCEKRKIESKEFIDGENSSLCIGMANHWFGYLYSCYPSYISFVILGLTLSRDIYLNGIVAFLVILAPIGLFYIPAYRAVFSKDRYLKYFKKFEKEDAHWHKKWGRITTLFCIGAVAAALLGIVSMIAIAES